MKYFLLCLFLILLFSCKKKSSNENTKCYKCTLTGNGGVRNICTNRIDTVQFFDNNGNPYGYACELQ